MTTEIDYKNDNYKFLLIRAFNNLNVEHDNKKAKEFLIQYAKLFGTKEQQENARRITDLPNAIGWLCQLHMSGANLSPAHVQSIQDVLNTQQQELAEPEKEDKRNPRQFVKDKAIEYLGELEWAIDAFLFEDKEFSLYNDMRAKQLPGPYVSFVREWVQQKIEQFEKEDLDYYSFSKRKYNALIKFLNSMLEDCDKYQNFKRANRKPRAKKKIPPIVQVKNLNYQKECEEFGLKSVSPALIVGASQVWVFNTKTRKLGVYHSDSPNGMRVKGSTIQGFNPDTSVQKTVRKPEEVLTTVLESGKILLRKVLSELSTKDSPLTGRINNDTIILRVL